MKYLRKHSGIIEDFTAQDYTSEVLYRYQQMIKDCEQKLKDTFVAFNDLKFQLEKLFPHANITVYWYTPMKMYLENNIIDNYIIKNIKNNNAIKGVKNLDDVMLKFHRMKTDYDVFLQWWKKLWIDNKDKIIEEERMENGIKYMNILYQEGLNYKK